MRIQSTRRSTVKHFDKITLNLIKIISLFMAVAAILLVVTISTAAGGGGDTPATAVNLDGEVNRGHLEPLEQHWFKFVPDEDRRSIDVEKSLTLIFTPKETSTQDYVHFYVYEEGQAQFYLDGDVNNMAALGGGTMVERDDNPVTGELVWTGWVFGPKTYYIGVFNDSDFPIDYHLFNADVKSAPLGEPEPPPEVETTTAPPEEVEGHPDVSNTDPVNTASLDPSGLTKGKLQPNSTGWYEFNKADIKDKGEIVDAGFTLFATPLDGNSSHNVQVELFASDQTDRWLRGTPEDMTNFGAGMWVERDGDDVTGERVWKGSVIGGDTYLVAIRNSNDFEVDFWLFEGDIERAELGEKTVSPARVFAAGEAPTSAVPLKVGENVGRLSPGQQAWHRFLIADFDNEPFEEVALTMIFTPDDGGNRVHNVNMDVFEASGVQYWSTTDLDNSQVKNMGAGSIVFRDDNPWTGERVWQGWVVDNNVYFVQIRNGSDVDIDYHVFTGDVYRPPLGGEAQPLAEIAGAEPGTVPSAALGLGLGVNKGSLAVGEKVWYNFSRADVPAGGGETVFTLVFTPNEGDRVNQISVEVFDANQLTTWTPDLVINGFGESTTLDRDKNPQTGEIHWRGVIYPNAPYYVQLANNSDVPIDFWLFPEDVIDVSLE